MARGSSQRQAIQRRGERARRVRRAARATTVATVFALSAVAGFGIEETAVRPSERAEGFAPRPFAMSYAVREEIARAREARRIALAAAPVWDAVAPLAYDAPPEPTTRDALDRFDAFVGDAVALAPAAALVPIPLMRPGGVSAGRP